VQLFVYLYLDFIHGDFSTHFRHFSAAAAGNVPKTKAETLVLPKRGGVHRAGVWEY